MSTSMRPTMKNEAEAQLEAIFKSDNVFFTSYHETKLET